MMKKCVSCGAQLQEGSVFCAACGTKQPVAKFCPYCGTKLESDAVFCSACGGKFDGGVSGNSNAVVQAGVSLANASIAASGEPCAQFIKEGFMDKYFSFSGRLNRKRYWLRVFGLFAACLIICVIAIVLVQGDLIAGMLVVVVGAMMELPMMFAGLSLGVRRMHDVDKPGWYILIPFYSLYLVLIRGTSGANRFGPDPLEYENN